MLKFSPSRNLLSRISKVYLSPHKTCAHYTSFGEWTTKFLLFNYLYMLQYGNMNYFIDLEITFGDVEIHVISRGARSLIIMMNVSEMSCWSSMLSSCTLAIWRKSYCSNLCPKYASKNFFGLQMKGGKKSLPWEGDISQTPPPPPLGRFAPSQFSS